MPSLNLADFGVRPDGTEDARPALAAALAACRQQRASRMLIPPGNYHLRHPGAEALMHKVLSGMHGANPEPAMFAPHLPALIGIDMTGQRELCVEAAGARFLMHGFGEVLRLQACDNVDIVGLSIDHARLPYSLARLRDRQPEHFDIELLPGFDVPGPQTACARFLVVDHRSGRLRPDREPGGAHQRLSATGFRVLRALKHAEPGDLLAMSHTLHARPGIRIEECKNVSLRDVRIHSQAGMGVVGHRSHDTRLIGLQVVPPADGSFSSNTDATHFTSCSGFLQYDNCRFQGHGDDAMNVHGYYYTVTDRRGCRCLLEVRAPTGTHSQTLDYPDPGAELELVAADTLRSVGTRRVVASHPDRQLLRCEVELDAPLPDTEALLLADVSRLPQLSVRGCHFQDHISRSILVKTRQVLIENNTFIRSGSTAIHVAPEAWWHEAGSSRDVTIRNNTFRDCGRCQHPVAGTSAIAVGVRAGEQNSACDVHRDLAIVGNSIQASGAACGIHVAHCTGVEISSNTCEGCVASVSLQHCQDLRLDEQGQQNSPLG